MEHAPQQQPQKEPQEEEPQPQSGWLTPDAGSPVYENYPSRQLMSNGKGGETSLDAQTLFRTFIVSHFTSTGLLIPYVWYTHRCQLS